MQFIELTQGYITVVDDNWYELLNQIKWHKSGGGGNVYAVCYVSGSNRFEPMHRVIMGAMPDQIVDHIDGNRLNNQRSNLRFCNYMENSRNQRPTRRIKNKPTASVYKGVSLLKCRNLSKPWAARVFSGGKYVRCQYFATEEEAARAYDKWVIELFGDFARTNFPREGITQEKYFEF